MKKFSSLLFYLLLFFMAVISLGACSDEEDDYIGNTTPIIPDAWK